MSARCGEGHHLAKLTACSVRAIFARRGEKTAAVALEYGVSDATVWGIWCGRTWGHVTGAVWR